MNILVCLKVVPKTEDVRFDPATKTLDRSKAENEINPADKNALELALQLKEKHGSKVTILSMGPPLFEPHLRLAMAMGADDAILLSDRRFAGADTFATSLTLATAIKCTDDYQLVLCGEESSDASTGQVPSGIAEWLGIPQVTYVRELSFTDEGVLRARRTVRGGYEVVEAKPPVLVTVELGVNTPRFPDFRRKKQLEERWQLTVWDAERLGLEAKRIGLPGSKTIVDELVEVKPPQRRREIIEGSSTRKVEELLQKISHLLKPPLG